MNKQEQVYELLFKLREDLLSRIKELPPEIKKEAALYVLKMLTVEIEHLPTVMGLFDE